MPDPQVDIDTIREITDMFIESGIHMDAVNIDGLTAAQICTSRMYFLPFFFFYRSTFHFLFILVLYFFDNLLWTPKSKVHCSLCFCFEIDNCFIIFLFGFSFLNFFFFFRRLCALRITETQHSFRFYCDDMNLTRSVYDVLHPDA